MNIFPGYRKYAIKFNASIIINHQVPKTNGPNHLFR